MLDAKKEERRKACRDLYRLSVEKGYFYAARTLLRNALAWRSREARAKSKEWCYNLRGGRLNAFEYKCSY